MLPGPEAASWAARQDRIEILILCTANVCRSPMARALLDRELTARGVPALVHSAGTLAGGLPPPPEVVAVMARHSMDVAGHVSSQVTADDLDRAGVILAMTREHLRHAVVMAPDAWSRAFTIRELVRRGTEAGPRQPGEKLDGWLARVHDGRSRMALLGDSPEDDIEDPIGGALAGYEATAAELARLTAGLAGLGWPAPAR
jgi:protein-tyrosine phosphatase